VKLEDLVAVRSGGRDQVGVRALCPFRCRHWHLRDFEE
jgi:hypothetical protein